MIKTDIQAFEAFPDDSHLYDKLRLSKSLGYRCGDTEIPENGLWIVRPITNLKGMGRGAVIRYFEKGEKVDSGLFYCEVFEGKHITIDYIRKDNVWYQDVTFEGKNVHEDLIHFVRWTRVDYHYPIPDILKNVEANHINIEVIGGKVIEVHLRPNPDPIMHDDFWPIWSEDQNPPFPNYVRIPDNDNETEMGRLGFYVPGG
jgi:hypothetical protein